MGRQQPDSRVPVSPARLLIGVGLVFSCRLEEGRVVSLARSCRKEGSKEGLDITYQREIRREGEEVKGRGGRVIRRGQVRGVRVAPVRPQRLARLNAHP